MLKPFKVIATAIAQSPNMAANIAESLRIKEMIGEQLILIHIGEQTQAMEKAISDALPASASDVKVVWEVGDPVDAILKAGADHNIDLLIAGAQPREGLLKYYMGSIARRLVRRSNCSVLLLTHPSKMQSKCGKIVVDGLDHPKTPYTIDMAIRVANRFGSNELIIVEEVQPKKVGTRIEDDRTLEEANKSRSKIRKSEDKRIKDILSRSTKAEGFNINQKCIFGKRGYSIGHFTQQACADLLVMNSPDTKLGFLDRVFTHDLEYILSELPSDLLIVHSTKRIRESSIAK